MSRIFLVTVLLWAPDICPSTSSELQSPNKTALPFPSTSPTPSPWPDPSISLGVSPSLSPSPTPNSGQPASPSPATPLATSPSPPPTLPSFPAMSSSPALTPSQSPSPLPVPTASSEVNPSSTPFPTPSITQLPPPSPSPAAPLAPSPSTSSPLLSYPGPSPLPTLAPSPLSSPNRVPSPTAIDSTHPKSVPIDDTILKERAKDYEGVDYKLVLVGEKKYVLPEGYIEQGALYYNFVPKTDDIFIITYPTGGYLWFSELLYQLAKSSDDTFVFKSIRTRVPLLESPLEHGGRISQLPVDILKSPRIIRTQLPPSLIPNIVNKGKKVVYVVRNPKDILVSLYRFSKRRYNFTGNIARFFYYFQNNLTTYSPYWVHTNEGLALQGRSNILVVFDEDSELIEKVTKFLGKNDTIPLIPKVINTMARIKKTAVLWRLKIFSQRLNKAVNHWIRIHIGKIPFPNILNFYE